MKNRTTITTEPFHGDYSDTVARDAAHASAADKPEKNWTVNGDVFLIWTIDSYDADAIEDIESVLEEHSIDFSVEAA